MDIQQKLNEIASKHLGKAGDGTVVKPYVTPTEIDKTLLVPVPRSLNRVQYGIDDNNLPFLGVDVWNAYEFSTLTDNGFPVVGHLKVVYDADSPNIVESKSLKLYLNSFNMCKLGQTPREVINSAESIISRDLSEALHTDVRAHIFFEEEFLNWPYPSIVGGGVFKNIDKTGHKDNRSVYNTYNENPDLLVSEETTESVMYNFRSSVLRSNCRVTNQPDWGDVFIGIESKHKISEQAILAYLISMRNENHFHEEICECIYKRLMDKFSPSKLFVGCLYTRRGGIDINPIRASDKSMMQFYAFHLCNANIYTQKTWRQ